MRFVIVTQTFPPRVGGMQDVMESLSIKLSYDYETVVLPDHRIPTNHPILKRKINFIFTNFPKLIRNFITGWHNYMWQLEIFIIYTNF